MTDLKKLRASRPVDYCNTIAAMMRADCRAAVHEITSTTEVATVEVPAAFVGAVAQWLDTSHRNTERDQMPVTEHAHAVRIAEAWGRLANFNGEGVVVPYSARARATRKAKTDHA